MAEDLSFEEAYLHTAASEGDLKRVAELVEGGMCVNRFDEIGKTPLHYAAEGGHLDVVDYLLSHGADANAHDESVIGNTPLREIAGNCSLSMARLLVKHGANPRIRGWMQLCALDLSKNRKRGDGPSVHALLGDVAKRM